jgi:uncharacterized membrane protein YqjE
MADDAKPRLAGGLRGFLATGVKAVQTRLELLAVEVREEEHRLAALLFNLVLAALFTGFGVVAVVILVTVALWDSHRLVALGVGAAVLLGGALFTGATAARLARQGSHLFASSLAELARDRDELERRP